MFFYISVNNSVKLSLRFCYLIAISFMKQHLGAILEKAVRQSGYPISKLANRIGYTRQHVYNLFAKQHVDLVLLEKIGKTINHNFSDDVKQLKKYEIQKQEFDISVNKVKDNDETNNFKEMYYSLLEEYTALLKENTILVKRLYKK